jgi:hypothetical protein
VIRLAFVLLVLAFGTCLFLAGVCAPPGLREPLAGKAHEVAGKLVALEDAIAQRITGKQPVSHAPVPYKTLLLTSPSSEPHAFGVQLGLDPDSRSAAARAERLAPRGYPLITVPLGSGATPDAYLVAAGPFDSVAAASQAAKDLLSELPAGAAPLVIAWPAPASPPPAGSSPNAAASPSAGVPVSNP